MGEKKAGAGKTVSRRGHPGSDENQLLELKWFLGGASKVQQFIKLWQCPTFRHD